MIPKSRPSRDQPLTGIADRLSAALADRYTIEGEIGRGGMATVYLARDRNHDRPVAPCGATTARLATSSG